MTGSPESWPEEKAEGSLERGVKGIPLKIQPPDRGIYTHLAIKEQIVKIRNAEIRRGHSTMPEVFESDDYKEWQNWAIQTLGEGLKKLRITGNEGSIALPVTREWAFTLTQEGYPFHELPDSWALASALSFELAMRLMETEEFLVDSTERNSNRLQLINWLSKNPLRFKE